MYLTSDPERTLDYLGKTRAWNAAGEEPPGLVAAIPPGEDGVSCWRGDWSLPAAQQGLLLLGSPVGTREFIAATLDEARAKHAALFARLPDVQDLQCAWLLLLFCAAPRWTYLLRSVPPADTASFAAAHDEAVLECLGRLLSGADTALAIPPASAQRAHLPRCMGGLGLPSATAHRHAAYWASWADTIGRRRWRTYCARCSGRHLPCRPAPGRQSARAAAWLRLQGFEAPSWTSLLDGAAPSRAAAADSVGPPTTRKGWQRCAGAAVEKRALELLFSDLDPASRALLLSQSGPGASCAMTVLPTGPDFAVPSDEFRIMLLRRLRMPLPLAPKRCRCGGALDEY